MVISSGLEKGQDSVTIRSAACLKVFQIKVNRQKQRFQAPILARTVTAQSQANPTAMSEEREPIPLGHPRQERMTRLGRKQLLQLHQLSGAAWNSFCSQQPEAAQLVRFRRRIQKRHKFRSKCFYDRVPSGLLDSGHRTCPLRSTHPEERQAAIPSLG